MKKILLLLIITMFLISCGKDEKETVVPVKEDITTIVRALTKYDLITHETSGIIHYKSPISIVLNPNYVNESEKIFKNDTFKIEPYREGELKLVKNILTFIPKDGWNMRTNYKFTLFMDKIFPNIKKEFDSHIFSFETNGIEIFDINLDAENVINNRDLYTIKGNIEFNTEIDLESVQNSIKGYKIDNKGNKKYFPLVINMDKNKRNVLINSSEMQRNKNMDEYIYIEIIKDKLNISESKIREIKIASVDKFELLSAIIQDNNDKFVELNFNNEIMSDFDLNGYFYIEPNINFSISKKSKKIKLTGNFEYEKEYNITIRKGIKNNLGEQLENDLNIILKLEDFKPKIEFTNSGVFLPTTNKSKINFKAINVLNAYVQVMKIHDNNIFYYLQDFDLIGNKTYGQDGGYNFYRIGEEIYSQEINLDKDVNKWKKYELDLEKIFSKDSTGIYFITLSFSEHDILGNYFNNKERWVKQNFFYNSASISKPVIISNIALHAKYAKDKLYIQSIDVLTGKPMPNIKIKTKNYINKQLEEGITDSNGKLILKSSDVFSVEGEYKSQKTFLKLNRDLDMSGFDIEGGRIY